MSDDDTEDTRTRRDSFISRALGIRRGRSPCTWLLVHEYGTATLLSLLDGQTIVVGRDGKADCHLADPLVSRQHARFIRSGESVWVEDLGSRNGTYLNGAAIDGKHPLQEGDEVKIGETLVQLHVAVSSWGSIEGLTTHDRIIEATEREVFRSLSRGRSGVYLMVRVTEGNNRPLGPTCGRLRHVLRSVDQIALYSWHIIEVLLPDVDRGEAERLVELIAADQDDGADPLRIGVAFFPAAGATVHEVTDRAREALSLATADSPTVWVPSPGPGELPGRGDGIVSLPSPQMARVMSVVRRVAPTSAPVLLLGETGVGKEVIARAIHEYGPRSNGRMVAVNCGAIPPNLLEGTLFGHERGAFTGADRRREGLFEAADGGTLFLDEVGELAASAQAALLRVLETQVVTRVGGTTEKRVDVRVVCATNRDLEAMCARKEFRMDLLYRLNMLTIRVPPLRERREDIEPLAFAFLDGARSVYGARAVKLSNEAVELLMSYDWPGNVRELRNTIHHAALNCQTAIIEAADLGQRLHAARDEVTEVTTTGGGIVPVAGDLDFKERVSEYERRLMLGALHQANWNRKAAARMLRMPERTFRHKFRALGLEREEAELGRRSDDDDDEEVDGGPTD